MGMIAPLTYKESKILAELHTLKAYEKNTIIDQQGTVSKAVYYTNEDILAMKYKKNQKFLLETSSLKTHQLSYIPASICKNHQDTPYGL